MVGYVSGPNIKKRLGVLTQMAVGPVCVFLNHHDHTCHMLTELHEQLIKPIYLCIYV